MPLSEFYGLGSRKMDSTQQKSSDVSVMPDNEFVELVWENGQLMMQGQSSKSKKTLVSSNFQFQTSNLRDNKNTANTTTTSKTGKFESFEPTFSDIAVPVPSAEMNLNHDDDDMARWLNYHAVDDYCSGLIPEVSGETVTDPSKFKEGNVLKLSSSRTGELYPWFVSSMPSLRSGVSDLISNNTLQTRNPISRDLDPAQHSAGVFPCTKNQKQENSSFLNFSHFLRPNKANLHTGVAGPSGSLGSKDKSPLSDKNGGEISKEMGTFSQANLDSSRLVAKPVEESPPAEHCEDKSKNDKCANKCRTDNEKTVEPIVAASSVCSGNSVERASNDLTNNLKRKSRDTDDSEWQSEDVDEELVGVKRTTSRGTGSKRSRVAEVHNLSERRRRDRINEKMRALQELIPNCNKVDKASMLDEAIEYLKTLQFQVQIMSMGAGLYMPPMMFPTGMHQMPHFSPMGLGMGMGFGMGMGMDLNAASRGCSMLPVQGVPYSNPPGSSNFHGAGHQVFGHPGQVLPMTVSGSPMVPLPVHPPMDSNSKDSMQNTQVVHNADPSKSMDQTSSQFRSINEGFGNCTMQQKTDLGPDAVGGGPAVKSLNANETVPSI